MLYDLKVNIWSIGIATGTAFSCFYAMNLNSFIANEDWGLAGVTGISAVLAALMCWYGLVRLRRLRRIKMDDDSRRAVLRNPVMASSG
jgi:magnesium transporter